MVEEIKQHLGMMTEALLNDLRQVAEGHSSVRDDIQDFRSENSG